MKIFVTGGTGFIGNYLVLKLHRKGHDVSVLVRTKDQQKRFESLGIKAIIGDITNSESFRDSLKNNEVVINLAAIRSNWESQEKFKRINSDAIRNLFITDSKIKHVIITSSVYAMGNLVKIPADESHPLRATDLYGKSKIVAEKLTKQYSEKTKIPYTIIRPAIVYGPKDNDLGMIVKLVKFIKNRSFPIIGSGKNLLHLIYIDDLINGYLKVIEKGGYNKTYILAGANTIQLIDIVRLIKDELKIDYKDKYVPKVPLKILAFGFEIIYFIGSKIIPSAFKNEPIISNIKIDIISNNWYYDVSKAKKELGFKPDISYEIGIKRTVNWLKSKYGY